MNAIEYAKPFLEGIHQVVRHTRNYLPIRWDDKDLFLGDRKVALFLAEGQDTGKVSADIIRGLTVSYLGDGVLGFLLANQEKIPDAWKGKRVAFWGTVYRYNTLDEFVLALYYEKKEGKWTYHRLAAKADEENLVRRGQYGADTPAAILE